MSKFTGDTWRWEIPDDFSSKMPALVSERFGEICNFGDCATYYPTEGNPPMPEEMALIEAAPKLLAALQNAVGVCQAYATQSDTARRCAEIGNAVIEQATRSQL